MISRALALGTLLVFSAVPASAAMSSAPVVEVRAGDENAHIFVPVDKGQLLHIDRPFKRVSVGTREIADVQPMANGMLYVVGKKTGSTNLTFRDSAGEVVAVVDVVVTEVDVGGLTARLRSLMPDENIEVAPSGDGIVLSGQVTSSDHLRQAVAVAERFAPGKITNVMTVAGSQQVLLEVKFAEVARTALMNLRGSGNINWAAGSDFLNSGWGPVISGTPGSVDPSKAYGALASTFSSGNFIFKGGFEALEKKGLIRTLAEPNLVALSGDTASFLAGGEFPIPVAQAAPAGGLATVTVEYKDYGVGLSFTPTIVSKELVNLMIRSEVSSIDDSLAVKANGFDIPALKTRRAKTTVELRDGQSFAIAGLLQDDFANATEQLPLLGNIPVLGALFRSPNYKHNQTDLVIIITVHLVQPTVAANLATPIASLPSKAEHFGLDGRVEDKSAKNKQDKEGFVLP